MGGVDTGRSGNVSSHVLGVGINGDNEDSFDLDMDTGDDATGRDNPTVFGGMGGGALNLSLGRDDTLVSRAMGVGPLNLSLGTRRDNPTVSGHGGMGVASLNLSMCQLRMFNFYIVLTAIYACSIDIYLTFLKNLKCPW